MSDLNQHRIQIYCDGGIGNRINSLVSGLAIANYFKIQFCINWPINNWCQAAFHDIFNNQFPIINESLQSLKGSLNDHDVLLHDEIASNTLEVKFSSAYSYASLQSFEDEILANNRKIFFYPALIPDWIPFELIIREIQNLTFTDYITENVRSFIAGKINAPYHGLHLRRTDLHVGLTDEEVIKVCQRYPQETFFVCSDDPHAEALAASYPNVHKRDKHSHVVKKHEGQSWIAETLDDDGRAYHGNIVRPKDSVIEGVIDLLILAHSRIIGYSGSTFQRLAKLIGELSPIVIVDKPNRLIYHSPTETRRNLALRILSVESFISTCHQIGVQGDIHDAISILQSAISQFEGADRLDVMHTLAVFHLNQNQPQISEIYLAKIISQDSKRFSSWLNLAYAHHLIGDQEACKTAFDLAKKHQPSSMNTADHQMLDFLEKITFSEITQQLSSHSIEFANQEAAQFDGEDELQVERLKHLIKKEDPVILEIGANCGQTTAEFLKVFPKARIYCFEPDPRAIAKFKRNIQSPNVQLIEAAVGASSGYVTFNQSSGVEWVDPEGWDHSGSIRKPKSHLETWPWVKFESQIEVPILKLDDWLLKNDIGTVDFIWADVQGAEEDLILGGTQALESASYFYTEFSDEEWYEGQVNFDTLSKILPKFSLLKKFKNDALFIRNNQI